MTIYYYLKRIEIKADSFSIIPFKSTKIVIGRAQTCDFIIPDAIISRCHAVVHCRDNIWYMKNLSSSGVKINDNVLPYNKEEVFAIGDLVQFGQSPEYLFRFTRKEINETQSYSSVQEELESLSSKQESLECKLQHSNNVKEQLLAEKKKQQDEFIIQKQMLGLQWSEKLVELEKIRQEGVNAHLSLLQEKENLAEQLRNEVREMAERVETNKIHLETQLKTEEDFRQNIMKEKELITTALQSEKNALQEELRRTEESKAELVNEMQQETHSLQKIVEMQERVKQKQLEEADKRKMEQAQMQKRLEQVENTLQEKNVLTCALQIELDSKAQAEERMVILLHEKEILEKRLADASKNEEEIVKLKSDLKEHENQKQSLEMAGPSVTNVDEREKIVSSVTNVVENELQCPICSELFVKAVTLNCSHTFCQHCIEKWKKQKKECPNCRSFINGEARSLVVDNFIDRIVETLSDDMKNKREEIIAERDREIRVQRETAVAAVTNNGRRRGRARGRGARRRVGGRRTRATARNARVASNVSNAASASTVTRLAAASGGFTDTNAEPLIDLTGFDTSSEMDSPDYMDLVDMSDSDDMSDEGEYSDAYYGGYGMCYICGGSGHWANGCYLRY